MLIPLIDGDIITYKSAFAAQHKRYHGHESDWVFVTWKEAKEYIDHGGAIDHTEEIIEPEHHALHNAKKMIETICEKFTCPVGECLIFLTETNDETSFRKKIAKTKEYKANRKKQEKPSHYLAVRNYLQKRYDTKTVRGIEADDALAIVHTTNQKDTIICTIDKDLLQVPGNHYHIDTQEIQYITEAQGHFNLFRQILKGDVSDNIPGLPRIGEKTSTKIIQEAFIKEAKLADIIGRDIEINVVTAYFHEVYRQYLKVYDNDEQFWEMANLCFILRKRGQYFKDWLRENL